MFSQIKKRIDKELHAFTQSLDKEYRLRYISPLLSSAIKDFVMRDGKRIRPCLFIIGYRGFSPRRPRGLYKSAVAIELLHDFMLIHDDIIDKSEMRRNKPAMHILLHRHLLKHRNIKFNGQDLAIVAGDVLYALAIDAFLSIAEHPHRKEQALKTFVQAAMYTGCGEFIELIHGIKNIGSFKKEYILDIYDFKTAHYTFSAPLTAGATLAGTRKKHIAMLRQYGMYLGRAFQIKDDLLGLCGEEKKIGKSILTDLQEAKKTLIIWQAYKLGSRKQRRFIKQVLKKRSVGMKDLYRMRQLAHETGAVKMVTQEINRLVTQSRRLIQNLPLKPRYQRILFTYPSTLLAAEC